MKAIEEPDQDTTTSRVVRLSLLCLLLAALAGFFTYVGVQGFVNPPAVPTGSNSIQLGVSVSKPSVGSNDLPSGSALDIYASFFPDDNNYAEYKIAAPAKFAGKKFLLMLAGSAQIDSPSVIFSTYKPALASRLISCHYKGPNGVTVRFPCQIISGTFPSTPNADAPSGGKCTNGTAPVTVGRTAVEIEIGGVSHIAKSDNWSYKTYMLPSLGDDFDYSYENQWYGTNLGGWYETAVPTGCKMDILPANAEVTDAVSPATVLFPGELVWDGGDAWNVTALITRRRDSDAIANTFLALGAATAALAIGFVPVAYEANRSRIRSRKRGHSRPTGH